MRFIAQRIDLLENYKWNVSLWINCDDVQSAIVMKLLFWAGEY